MAEKKKKPEQDPLGFKQAGQTVRKAISPFTAVMGAMDKAGRWLFGEPKQEKRKKRLEQSKMGGK